MSHGMLGFRWLFPLGIAWAVAANGAAFHVAPAGSDQAPGTREQPFKTLARARDAARRLPEGEPRRILVRGGDYHNVSLALGPEDSGLTIEAAPDEQPVLYGGQPIRGWTRDGQHFYAARLPAFPALPPDESPRDRSSRGSPALSQWEIRALQVNGQWRPRSRFPAKGELEHLNSFSVPWMSTTGGGWKRKPTPEELTTLTYRPEDLPADLEIRNAEVTVFHMWDESCVGIAARDAARHVLTLAQPTGHPPGAFGVKKYVLWNTREGMTRPGQWYHDRARGRLVYWPLPGEVMDRAEVIAPTATTILRLEGRPEAKVRHVTVRGLTLAVTTVPLVAAGFAASRFDGALSLAHAEECTFSGLTIRGAAGHGIKASRGEARIRVEDCEVTACGAGGVYVGGAGTVISNNHIHAIGLAYPSAVGLARTIRRGQVSHNEIHDCPYSAISCGSTESVFEDNLLYDCMKVLHDGAAIYLFAATNCVIRRNVARNIIDTGGYGASAYYLDERSTGCVVENNLALNVLRPSHHHMATNNIVRNNVFIVPGDARITLPRCADYTFERNILHATGKIRIEGVNAVTNWSRNLFWSGAGKVEGVELDRYASAAVAEGAPGDTVLADPRFRDRANGDYGFQPGSPALKLGIAPVDVRHAGRVQK